MIGWKPNPFIFIHIPKCAGSSIERALIPHATPGKVISDLCQKELAHFWLPGKSRRQHSTLRSFARNFVLADYFKFSFVRNPWDRAVSQIGYQRKHGSRRLFPDTDFKHWLHIYCNTREIALGQDLGACQMDYLENDSGTVAMDFIGRFESLARDFQTVCAAIGINPAPDLPHIYNADRTLHYSAFFDEESSNWIKSRFARDIAAFGYKFETG